MLPLNDIQFRFWMDDCLRSDNAYNVSYAFHIEGDLDELLLEQALHQVMAMYEPFHSTIKRDGMTPFFQVDKNFHVPLYIETTTDICVDELIDKYAGKRFSLETEYPCRFYIFKTTSCSYLLTLFHHIVMDGLTMVEFCDYLSLYYQAYFKNVPLPTLPVPTLEEFNNQCTERTSEEKEEDITYWTNYLKDLPIHFPITEEDKTVRKPGSMLYAFNVGEELCKRSIDFAKKQQSTPFRLYASVWSVVLQYFLQTESIVLDHTVHLRPKAFKGLLGSFVNNLPISIPFERINSFSDLLHYMDNNRKLERLHQRATYTDIILRMRNRKELTENRELFNLSIDYPIRNNSFKLNFPSCHIRFYKQVLSEMIGDICLVIEENENLPCSIRYKQGIDPDFIQSLADAFILVLKQVMDYPMIPLSQLRFISKEKEESLLNLSKENLYALLPKVSWVHVAEAIVQWSKEDPDKTALRFNGKSLSYGELNKKADGIAFYLNKNIGQGKPVGILMNRGFEMIIAILGVIKSGNHYVPFDVMNPLSRLNQIISDCKITLVLADDKTAHISLTGTTVLPIRKAYLPGKKGQDSITEDQTAYVIYTSGTTGKPKGIAISHSNLNNLVRNDISLFQLSKESIMLLSSNICFDASVTEIFSTLTAGAEGVIAKEEEMKDPSLLAQLIKEENITCATIPPALLPLLPQKEYPTLKTIILGGECTSAKAVNYWKKRYTVINAYGPTENTVDTSVCILTDDTPVNDIGTPLTGVACYVLDKQLRLLPNNVPGELYIGGKQLSNGYLNNPEMSRELFIPNPFQSEQERKEKKFSYLYKSGDLVKRLANHHLLFMGRTDFQVKIRGLRIELEDITSNINRMDCVNQAFVHVQTIHGEKQLVAYVEPKRGETLSTSTLKKQLMEAVPSYMVPNYWAIVQKLPLNQNGKINVKALPQPVFSNIEVCNLRQPKTLEEVQLCKIVATVMGIDAISPDADLFDWGISSIQVMQAAFEAERIGLNTSVSKFYESRTISKILANEHSRFCYWANTREKEKPILLIICGYPYLSPSYDSFVAALKEDFSILVIESYNEYFIDKETCTLEALLSFYTNLLRVALKGEELAGITGLCLGGEIALQLAYRLDQLQIAHPKVFVLDGFSDRLENKNNTFIEEPGIDKETNELRNRISDALINSFFFHAYQGEVHICLANQFTRHLSFENQPEVNDPVLIQKAYKRFVNNGDGWKRLLPNCHLHSIPATHWSIMRGEGLERIKEILIHSLYPKMEGPLT